MIYRLIIKPSAEKDMEEAYVWYNQKQDGLGNRFLDQVERSLQYVVNNPHQYQFRYKEVRMIKVNRFPFCLHYTVEVDAIFVHAVLSTSRNPEIWKIRMK